VREADLLLADAAEVVTVDDRRAGPLRRPSPEDLGVLVDASVAVRRGRVVAIGPAREVRAAWRPRRTISCRGRVVLPGLVDAHTHPVFARMREEEFALRCRGASYEEILAAGGGIYASARALAQASPAHLARVTRSNLERMLRHGTTTVEAKSGYGLGTAGEIASLEALRAAAGDVPIHVVPTLLGAHVVPEAFRSRRSHFVREVIEKMLPLVAKRRLADYCDVFVERGAFTPAEARRISAAAKRLGLGVKLHVDQFRDGRGAALAARLGAISADHLDATNPAGVRALARAGTVAVLLPSAAVFTGLSRRPDARALIDAGVPVALASDFNPGTSPSENLFLAAALGTSLLAMTPEEALVGVTRNAAGAVGRDDRAGRIAVGRPADLVVLDAPSWLHLAYRLGTNLAAEVIVGGRHVVSRGRIARAAR